MDKYWDPTATPAGEFTDGDPLGNPPVARTVLRDTWPNMIQRELINVVEGGGLTLDGEVFNQVFLAIQAMIDASARSAVPAGVWTGWTTDTAPAGWLECNVATLLRGDYPELFANIGTTWGSSNANNFNIPDFRGEFLRGWDNGRGVDPGRSFASFQTDEIKSHTHPLHNTTNQVLAFGPIKFNVSGAPFDDGDTGATGGTETRPRNMATMIIIKT